MRIFISYGHDSNEKLVRQIKADLEKRGHEIWFDESKIKVGDDWRCSITEGIVNSHRVLAFLSKHSTRDPGVCLDEIAIAIGVKRGNIHPILVESENEVRPPASISHIQWLDMHDWREHWDVGRSLWKKWYQEKLSEIVRVVENDESRRFAGEIRMLEDHLKPISSDSRIFQLLKKEFVGRVWLDEAIEQWRNSTHRTPHIFWIMGAPGVGKSAFAAHLAHYGRDKVIAVQFCEYDKIDHRSAQRIVRTLAFQIATRLPDYRKFLLTLPEITELDSKNSAELFDYLLAGPLRYAIDGSRERYVMVIDALDEAGENGRNELVEVLARNALRLPDWIGIIITSRPEENVTSPMQGINPFILDNKAENNRADIRDYLRRNITSHLQNSPNADSLIEQILERSEGVFLYVERFCDDVQRGHISLDHPEQFPQGLGGIFFQYFRRQFYDLSKFRNKVRPALRAILAARESLPLHILQHFFNWQDEELNDFRSTLGSLFEVTTEANYESIKPYHKTLDDWLTNKAKAGPYFVSTKEGHRMLADLYSSLWRMNDIHALRELPYHYLAICQWSNLAVVLTDIEYLDYKCRALGVDAILVDFVSALDSVPSDAQERAMLIQAYIALDGQAHILRQESQILPQVIHNELAWTTREPKLWESTEKAIGESKSVLLLDTRRPAGAGECRPLRTIVAPGQKLTRIAISPDGRWLAGACGDLGTCIWEAETGILRRVLRDEPSHDLCVQFNFDGTKLATGGWWSCLRIWDPDTGMLVRSIDINDFIEDLVYSAAWSAFVFVDIRGSVYILHEGRDDEPEVFYEAPPEDPPQNLPEFLLATFITQRVSQRIARIAVSPNGDFCAAAERSGIIGMADTTGAERGWVFEPTLNESEVESMPPQFQLEWEGVTRIEFSPNGESLVSTHRSFRWRIWNVHNSTPVHENRGHRASAVSLAFHPNGTQFATGGEDGEIHLWDVTSGRKEATIVGHFGFLVSLQFSPGGERLYSACDDGTIKVWNARAAIPLIRRDGHTKIVYGARFSPNARFLASWAEDFSLRIWRVADMHCEKAEELNWYILDIAFSPDERLCAVALKSGGVVIYDTHAWKRCHVFPGQTRGARCVEFSPDSKFVAVGDDDGGVSIWNALKGVKEITHQPLASSGLDFLGIDSLSFSADGSELYVGAGVPDIFICSMRPPRIRKVTPRSHVGSRHQIRAMTKSGRVVVNNASNTLEVVDTLSGHIVSAITGPVDWLYLKGQTVSDDDRYIATGGGSERVDLWSADTGTRIGTYHCAHSVLAVHFHRPTGRLFAADLGGSLHIPNVHEIRIAEPNTNP